MKGRNEFLVGLVLLVTLLVVVGGALWLSESDIGQRESLHVARFRTVGGLTPGAPVTYRGVRVGRVEAIRLADQFVEADLKVYQGVELPAKPAVIAASQSLFGEWGATIISRDQPQDDPNVRIMLAETARPGGDRWPGATLPDVGQLTAQAGRIATDIAAVAARVQETFDSSAVAELRRSIRDFGEIADKLVRFTESQTGRLNQVTSNVERTSDAVLSASGHLENTLARVDSATADHQLQEILDNARSGSGDLRAASQDLRALLATARGQEASLVRTLLAADSILTGIQSGQGTIGLLAKDPALYNETIETMQEMRRLIADIQMNPRKYFKFSVF
ncbi:MAG: MCE family protein [Gemmatimonadetes bacterium]|nr:MCE family protein [Gemmatimonadota bacterium]MBK7715967.1 MCE family protein [Gemmatimonadota bacterium]MBK9067777.1 MCE family protein [Gemmatimonadota bacterium]MBK9693324.1 MCE family protein [Gemmatimonadota bacterium]MBP9201772.1 MCE family protein [Gemmatimonadales bacterium]